MDIKQRAGAVLRPETGNPIIASGISHGDIDGDIVGNDDGVSIDIQECLQDHLAPLLEWWIKFVPAALKCCFKPLHPMADNVVWRGNLAHSRLDGRAYVP